ncbi:hypothetical protein BaRGS_00025862 [Batillaria attramentaria]|uniref:Uncharacterized protein n=1 Tax=Batillaria attramentaria TaxID=370345 RepID=A0ABD0K6A2_9CAEN
MPRRNAVVKWAGNRKSMASYDLLPVVPSPPSALEGGSNERNCAARRLVQASVSSVSHQGPSPGRKHFSPARSGKMGD